MMIGRLSDRNACHASTHLTKTEKVLFDPSLMMILFLFRPFVAQPANSFDFLCLMYGGKKKQQTHEAYNNKRDFSRLKRNQEVVANQQARTTKYKSDFGYLISLREGSLKFH